LNILADDVTRDTKRLLKTQLMLAGLVALIFLFTEGFWQANSALYGGGISILTALLLSRGISKASISAAKNPSSGAGILYFGAVQRFILVLLFFIFGLGVLKLEALATCVGFGIVQLGYVFNLRAMARTKH